MLLPECKFFFFRFFFCVCVFFPIFWASINEVVVAYVYNLNTIHSLFSFFEL